MLKIAGLFALWEIAKFFIGSEWMQENVKRPEVGCTFFMFEVPYIAWGVWLLFTHTWPALALWGLKFAHIIVYMRFRSWYGLSGQVKSAASAALLVCVFFGLFT
jgi:hypothetical protein